MRWIALALAAVLISAPNTQSQPTPDKGWPTFAWPRDGSASRALQSLSTFRTQYKCGVCKGSGSVTIRVKVGERRVNGMLHPVMKNREVECDDCEGTRYQPTERLNRAADRMLTDVLAVPTEDPKSDAVRKVLKDVAVDMASVNPEKLAKALNDEAATRLTDVTARQGAVVFLSGTLVEDRTVEGVGRVQVIDFPKKTMTVFLRDAWIVDATVGETVLVGARLAGRIEEGAGLVPVLQGGFVVGPDERRK